MKVIRLHQIKSSYKYKNSKEVSEEKSKVFTEVL
jgi:hypothetical protein